MSLIKTTSSAPEIFRSLGGILLVRKQANYPCKQLISELKERICDSLNALEPRPLSRRLAITGEFGEEKSVIDVPNLADHPLVVGPRYLPDELDIRPAFPNLGYRSSGLEVMLVQKANKYFRRSIKSARLPSIYHVDGEFGFVTHNRFHDGNILDKANYHNIRTGRMDSVLSKIESSQRERLFDSSNVSIHSQDAYELAKAWPSRPARMATWPVIYRIRCIHLKVPHFKLEVTAINESEGFLANVVHDVGIMLKSFAFTRSIRRVKFGPFSVDDSLTDKHWDLQSMIDNLKLNHDRFEELVQLFSACRKAGSIRIEYNLREIEDARAYSN